MLSGGGDMMADKARVLDLSQPDGQAQFYLKRRIARANIPPIFAAASLEDFETPTETHKRARREVEEWSARSDLRGLCILGPTGGGKTHLATAAFMERIRRGADGLFAGTGKLLREAMARSSCEFDEDIPLERAKSTPLLLLDDLGVGHMTEPRREALYLVINGRYEADLPTIVTSNLPIEKLNEFLGDRANSRLCEMCLFVELNVPDYRVRGEG